MEKSYNYSDIYLVPKYSEASSRKDLDTSVDFLGRKFKAPFIPANMASVISEENAKWLSENDYFYIYHRFGDTKAFVEKANRENWKLISISVGVKEDDKNLISYLTCYLVDFITIDIAHGHSLLMKEMISFIKEKYSKCRMPCPKIIAGNVCTPEAVKDLADWGADACKVGIAGGGACSTKNMTGFHVPMFSCVKDCFDLGGIGQLPSIDYNVCYGEYTQFPTKEIIEKKKKEKQAKIPIIADGGIRENGDIAKALVAGAKMVMAGSIFAACIDAPGENFYDGLISVDPNIPLPKIAKKRYFGSASAKQKGESGQLVKHIEGFELEIPCNELTYTEKYQELTESLQSSISYGGGKDLNCFKDVKWITVK